MIAKFGWFPQLRLASRAARQKQVIDEHCSMRNETIVTYGNQIADKGVRLNAASLSNRYAFLYFDERPYERVIANRATVQVCWFDDGDVLAELNVDESDGALFNRIHIVEA
jgi:hypothetical protein